MCTSAGNGWRFSNESGLTFAAMATGQIGTERIGSARLFEAFVDVDASGSFSEETLEAEALAINTLGVADTIEIAFTVSRHVDL